MPNCGKKHTPITSKKQRGFFGAELARRREGKQSKMKGITTEELEGHLKESGGKKLPSRSSGFSSKTAQGVRSRPHKKK